MFYLFIGSTALSKVPGVSAAGANPELTAYTTPADADLIRYYRIAIGLRYGQTEKYLGKTGKYRGTGITRYFEQKCQEIS
jgi:hypothetical protein